MFTSQFVNWFAPHKFKDNSTNPGVSHRMIDGTSLNLWEGEKSYFTALTTLPLGRKPPSLTNIIHIRNYISMFQNAVIYEHISNNGNDYNSFFPSRRFAAVATFRFEI